MKTPVDCVRCDAQEWRRIPGFNAYQVSDHGQLRSKTGRLMSPSRLPRGHLRVTLSRDGLRQSFQVHRLVLLAFVGKGDDGEEGMHLNDIPSDNCIKNLKWGSHLDNMRGASKNGRLVSYPETIKRAVLRAVAEGTSVASEAERTGVAWRTIYDWLRESDISRPKSSDHKSEVLAEIIEGSSVKEVAERWGIPERTVYRWAASRRKHGRA